MKPKSSYDFYLILGTALVLFAISLISIYGMFYFKFAQIQQMAPAVKMSYMNRMNSFIAPFIISLILLLGICVPKRLLPTAWLNRVTAILVLCAVLAAIYCRDQGQLVFNTWSLSGFAAACLDTGPGRKQKSPFP